VLFVGLFVGVLGFGVVNTGILAFVLGVWMFGGCRYVALGCGRGFFWVPIGLLGFWLWSGLFWAGIRARVVGV